MASLSGLTIFDDFQDQIDGINTTIAGFTVLDGGAVLPNLIDTINNTITTSTIHLDRLDDKILVNNKGVPSSLLTYVNDNTTTVAGIPSSIIKTQLTNAQMPDNLQAFYNGDGHPVCSAAYIPWGNVVGKPAIATITDNVLHYSLPWGNLLNVPDNFTTWQTDPFNSNVHTINNASIKWANVTYKPNMVTYDVSSNINKINNAKLSWSNVLDPPAFTSVNTTTESFDVPNEFDATMYQYYDVKEYLIKDYTAIENPVPEEHVPIPLNASNIWTHSIVQKTIDVNIVDVGIKTSNIYGQLKEECLPSFLIPDKVFTGVSLTNPVHIGDGMLQNLTTVDVRDSSNILKDAYLKYQEQWDTSIVITSNYAYTLPKSSLPSDIAYCSSSNVLSSYDGSHLYNIPVTSITYTSNTPFAPDTINTSNITTSNLHAQSIFFNNRIAESNMPTTYTAPSLPSNLLYKVGDDLMVGGTTSKVEQLTIAGTLGSHGAIIINDVGIGGNCTVSKDLTVRGKFTTASTSGGDVGGIAIAGGILGALGGMFGLGMGLAGALGSIGGGAAGALGGAAGAGVGAAEGGAAAAGGAVAAGAEPTLAAAGTVGEGTVTQTLAGYAGRYMRDTIQSGAQRLANDLLDPTSEVSQTIQKNIWNTLNGNIDEGDWQRALQQSARSALRNRPDERPLGRRIPNATDVLKQGASRAFKHTLRNIVGEAGFQLLENAGLPNAAVNWGARGLNQIAEGAMEAAREAGLPVDAVVDGVAGAVNNAAADVAAAVAQVAGVDIQVGDALMNADGQMLAPPAAAALDAADPPLALMINGQAAGVNIGDDAIIRGRNAVIANMARRPANPRAVGNILALLGRNLGI